MHRLRNPSEVLKIAADHHPDVHLVATGSSTLGASKKFKDTLAGRKAELWLTPRTTRDTKAFRNEELRHRFLHGGMPPFFLAGELPEREFQEWIDAYWAKDIQELFRLERRHSFQTFFELLMAHSEASSRRRSSRGLATSAGIAFRRRYPEGENYVVCQDVDRSFRRTEAGVTLEYVSLPRLVKALLPRRKGAR